MGLLRLLSGHLSKPIRVRRKLEPEINDRPRLEVCVEGVDGQSLEPLINFSDLSKWHVPDYLTEYLTKFESPTYIQRHSIPYLLEGRPVFATAPTGSGKTIAFLVPLFVRLRSPGKGFGRALILAPTRELTVQIFEECRKIRPTKKWKMTVEAVKHQQELDNMDIIVTTPGKALATIRKRGPTCFGATDIVILDECDRLLSENTIEQIDSILESCARRDKQILMFSATRPKAVQDLVESLLVAPICVSVGNPKAAVHTVTQRIRYVGNQDGKVSYIRSIRDSGDLQIPCLIFCAKKTRVEGLHKELLNDELMVTMLSSDMSDKQRDETVEAFRTGQFWVLLSTDLLARGMDFSGVKQVINYDMPRTPEEYIHRVGRTGRAGSAGDAITLVTEIDVQRRKYKMIKSVIEETNKEKI